MKTAVKTLSFLLCAILLASAFCACAAAEDNVRIDKVLIQTYPGQGGNDLPYVSGDISAFYAATTTTGVSVTGWSLVDDGGSECRGKVEEKYYTMNITLSSMAVNYVFTWDTRAYINNESANISYISDDGLTATFSRRIMPRLIAPTIWHNPTDETHNAGESFSFAASASPYYDSFQWYLRSPYNEKYEVEACGDIFDGTSAYVIDNGSSGTTCNLNNVSANFDGWMVYCAFKGVGGETLTQNAMIHIKNKPTPTPEPTPSPTPVPTSAPTIEIVVTPEPTSAITIIEHDYAEEWSYDEQNHWHEDRIPVSDSVSEMGAHDMVWTEITPATKKAPGEEKGVCSVCGYEISRSTEYVRPVRDSKVPGAVKWIVGIIGGLVVLCAAVVGIQYVKDKRRRARRAKMAGRHGKH